MINISNGEILIYFIVIVLEVTIVTYRKSTRLEGAFQYDF